MYEQSIFYQQKNPVPLQRKKLHLNKKEKHKY